MQLIMFETFTRDFRLLTTVIHLHSFEKHWLFNNFISSMKLLKNVIVLLYSKNGFFSYDLFLISIICPVRTRRWKSIPVQCILEIEFPRNKNNARSFARIEGMNDEKLFFIKRVYQSNEILVLVGRGYTVCVIKFFFSQDVHKILSFIHVFLISI